MDGDRTLDLVVIGGQRNDACAPDADAAYLLRSVAFADADQKWTGE